MVPRALWEGGGKGTFPSSKNQDQTAEDLTRHWANGPANFDDDDPDYDDDGDVIDA